MNFMQLKSFIAAAECENFTRAAERLYVSQPVLSRQISTMEDELTVQLFKREKKTVHLTPAGKIMYEGLVKILREYNVVVDNALASQNENANRLNIGFIEGQLFSRPFAAPVQAFRAANPDIRTNLKRYYIRELKEAILHGEIDVALVAKFKGLDAEQELEYLEVGMTPMVLAVPISHRLSSKTSIGLNDMENETLLILSGKESLIEATDISAVLVDIEHKEIIMPDIGAFALSIEAGLGIAPINNNHSLQNNPNLRFVPIVGVADFTETVLWRRDNANLAIQLLVKEFRRALLGKPNSCKSDKNCII
jgi:DNA-binding transcriptional LysR family regulator